MLQIAQNLERMAAKLSPAVLIGAGLVTVLLGLFIWLGGLGLRKILVPLIGAFGGGICGFFLADRNILPTLFSVLVGAILAVILEKIFITIMTAALAALFGFAALTAFYKADFSTGLKHACSHLPLHSWAIIAALAVLLLLAGAYLWRFTSALCCAALGTILVFAGMILLLSYKGAEPVRTICSKPSYYTAVFGAMIAFGTIEQLLLCPGGKKKPKKKKESDENDESSAGTRQRWRNR
ncbi:MAG TPA: hypothetical protein VMW16_09535 [Sedimentisphaerales bacterium]|nr:hypothetical protein [Sedimentisphaerales bacterium]